ncbi:hypothetical protein CROQUDRAFT_104998 [Cronartium quercuum f. sp. fusiforme G11]|uniref:Uncharacterized protein n=1 Tax=Cronartium quercuum f. sp. fusiforme G11 TaxID=708437 RepID=A0A9P6TF76_9BASI|nr:hypothetical protein CROQUDRAFT_104998 [Cronartium quercuum f. sp. fusiforme G11]
MSAQRRPSSLNALVFFLNAVLDALARLEHPAHPLTLLRSPSKSIESHLHRSPPEALFPSVRSSSRQSSSSGPFGTDRSRPRSSLILSYPIPSTPRFPSNLMVLYSPNMKNLAVQMYRDSKTL